VKFGKTTPDHIGFTGDISPTGIFIKSNYVFQPGTNIAIDLTLPNDKLLRLSGHVKWAKRIPPSLMRFVKKSGMGILLDHIPDEFYKFLQSLK
jgi:Tfp pilus assembly protein PilZ